MHRFGSDSLVLLGKSISMLRDVSDDRPGSAARWRAPWVAFALTGLLAQVAHAYKPGHHEEMAVASLRCAVQAQNAALEADATVDCSQALEEDAVLTLGAIGMAALDEDAIEAAVFWADDPVRETTWWNLPGLAKWGWRIVVDGCEDLDDGLVDGLRCSTHYGPLQFMHAMEQGSGVPAGETRAKILEWVRFTYEVARNETPDGSDKPFVEWDYCEYFASQDSSIAAVMLPEGEHGFPCNVAVPWTISTLFSFRCTWRSVTCTEMLGDGRPLARQSAVGAILHVIQDSYAKGHADRGGCCGPCENEERVQRFDCAPIDEFHDYGPQDHSRHGTADKDPEPWTNCKSGAVVHDPVTAGATVLRLLAEGAEADAVVEYVATHVFPLAADAAPSSAGRWFEDDAGGSCAE